jgi:CRISP-associated protein Cas1
MKKNYYLFNPGRMSRKDNTLKFTPIDDQGVAGQPRYLPVEGVDELYLYGSLDANSSLYNFLGKHQIPVHFFDYYENYTGSFMPRDQLLSGKVLVEQVQAHINKRRRLELARSILQGATHNIVKNLRYYELRGKETGCMLQEIVELADQIPNAGDIPILMGIEGNIRLRYYEAFSVIINDFEMGLRTKRPPQNEVNALISFGNMMCYSQCLRAIHQTQLNPTISYLHSPGDRRYSLALDLAEIFKPVLVDRMIFSMLNRRELKAGDFDRKVNQIMLKEHARKAIVQSFEQRLNETIQHRSLGKKVSYKYLIRLECYKLVKHILKVETYKPFKMWW